MSLHDSLRRMISRLRPALLLAAACTLGLSLTACAAPAGTVTIGHEDGSVTVSSGDRLVVEFGEVNASVGSDWVITTKPDPQVLSGGERHSEYAGPKDSVGGPDRLSYEFTAVGTGRAQIQFEYQFRGAQPSEPAERQTSVVEVTVR